MDSIIQSLHIEWQLVVTQIIGFLILIALVNKFGLKPIFAILDQRQADIKATYDQLDRDRAAMEQARTEYEQRLAGIETEAREKIQVAIKEAQVLRDNLVADARKQAEDILVRARSESERERARAFQEMRGQIVNLAVAAAGKVIGETISDARHVKLVDDFIASVNTGAIHDGSTGVSPSIFGQGGTAA